MRVDKQTWISQMFVLPKKRGTGEKNSNAKVNEEKVRKIRQLDNEGVSQYDIAKMFGLTQPSVNHIIKRRTWVDVD